MISRFLSERIIIIIIHLIYIYIVLFCFSSFTLLKSSRQKNTLSCHYTSACLCYLRHLDVLYIYTVIYDIVSRMRVHQISANYIRKSIILQKYPTWYEIMLSRFYIFLIVSFCSTFPCSLSSTRKSVFFVCGYINCRCEAALLVYDFPL